MNKLITILLLLVNAPLALAWNEKGHLVTARLAWRQLTQEQRTKVVSVLKKHLHHEEYLSARRPGGFSEDE